MEEPIQTWVQVDNLSNQDKVEEESKMFEREPVEEQKYQVHFSSKEYGSTQEQKQDHLREDQAVQEETKQ